MGLALRRSSRVGRSSGSVIEDEGVKRDVRYHVTRNDILNYDQDLMRFACTQLSAEQKGQLQILKADVQPNGIALTARIRNLFRLECSVNGRPQCSFAADGPQPFLVPTAGLIDPPSLLQVDGYGLVTGEAGIQQLQLVASGTIELQAEATPAAAVPAAAAGNINVPGS